jgi:hypothetical protein
MALLWTTKNKVATCGTLRGTVLSKRTPCDGAERGDDGGGLEARWTERSVFLKAMYIWFWLLTIFTTAREDYGL